MVEKKWKEYAVGVLIPVTVGGISALLSMEGMRRFASQAVKPPFTPPQWVFPVAWTILYILMGIGSTSVWKRTASRERSKGLNWYAVQLIFNFFWSLLFFTGRAYALALVWLVLLGTAVTMMVLQFRKVDGRAAWLQVPYLIWLAFATYLNAGVWILN